MSAELIAANRAANAIIAQQADEMATLQKKLTIAEAQRDIWYASLHTIADGVEPHWKGAGLTLSADWILDEIKHLGDLYEDLSAAADILAKWHCWIATGQLDFTNELLAESAAVLKRLGLLAVTRRPLTVAPDR